MENSKQLTINYNMVSFLQFIFSILVIALHCTRIFNNDILHFVQKSFFSRMAVPYFFMSSAFFIMLKAEINPNYWNNYLTKTIKIYLLWSLLFIPYGMTYFYKMDLPQLFILIAIPAALLYTGICYHLWYIPALLFGSLLTNKLIKYLGYLGTFSICIALYFWGSLETYSTIIKDTFFNSFYLYYKSYFFTTRNGLFFSPVYIFLGLFLFQFYHLIQKRNPKLLLSISTLLFAIEAIFIFYNQGDDKNFYLMLIPFTGSLFYWSITTHIFRQFNCTKLKQISVLFFFLHPVFIELFLFVFSFLSPDNNFYGLLRFIFTIFMCLTSFYLLEKIKISFKKKETNLIKKELKS